MFLNAGAGGFDLNAMKALNGNICKKFTPPDDGDFTAAATPPSDVECDIGDIGPGNTFTLKTVIDTTDVFPGEGAIGVSADLESDDGSFARSSTRSMSTRRRRRTRRATYRRAGRSTSVPHRKT